MIDLSHPTDSGAVYEIELLRDDGQRLMILDRIESFLATRVISNIGDFTINMPSDFPACFLAPDLQVWIWRKSPSGIKQFIFGGLVKRFSSVTSETGQKFITIGGVSYNWLLTARGAIATGGDQYTTLAAYLFGQQMANWAVYAPSVSLPYWPSALKVVTDTTHLQQPFTPSITTTYNTMPTSNLLDYGINLCNQLRSEGTDAFFDVYPTAVNVFEFRFIDGQPGRDLTVGNPGAIVFSSDDGRLSNIVYAEDYTDEVNSVWQYSTGSSSVFTGGGVAYSSYSSYATNRVAATSYSYRDTFVNVDAGTIPDAEAGKILSERRPLKSLTAKLNSMPGAVFGIDWEFGDKINVRFDGRLFETIVRAVTFGIDNTGREILEAAIEIIL